MDLKQRLKLLVIIDISDMIERIYFEKDLISGLCRDSNMPRCAMERKG